MMIMKALSVHFIFFSDPVYIRISFGNWIRKDF